MYVQDRLNRNDRKVYYALNTVYKILSSINIKNNIICTAYIFLFPNIYKRLEHITLMKRQQ